MANLGSYLPAGTLVPWAAGVALPTIKADPRPKKESFVQTRRFPRFPTDRSVTAVIFWDDLPIRKIHGRCHMLGEGGLGATLNDQLYVGDVVRLDIMPLPSIYAKVCNTQGTRHGFQFLFQEYGQRRAIAEACAAAERALRWREEGPIVESAD